MQLTQTIKLDCPHCGIREAAFTQAGQYNYSGVSIGIPGYQTPHSTVLFICPNSTCRQGVVAAAKNGVIDKFYPERQSDIPDHLPERVKSYFRQGINSLDGSFDAAGTMFRKSLEAGLKDKSPETKGNLVQRIKKLAESGSLTQDLADWADHIRNEGNDAAHDEFTKYQAEELHEFTKLVLTYLFTLPAIAERAGAARQDKKAQAKALPKA